MLSRTCTSASFSDPINELSANSGSNDKDGASKIPARTETANTGAASAIVDKDNTTNKDPAHREIANIDPASTVIDKGNTTNKDPVHTGTASIDPARQSIENEDTTNKAKAPVHIRTSYIDAATSTNIDNEDTRNKGLVHTQIANIDTASTYIDNTDVTNTSPANTSIDDIINAVNESMAKATITGPPKSKARRPWVKKLRKAGHFLIFG